VGFGRSVSHSLVEGIAENGRGAADFVLGTAELDTILGQTITIRLVTRKGSKNQIQCDSVML